MPYIADRVQETTTTTGTGAITLAGAVTNYQSFAAAFGSSSRVVNYLITSGANWEVGKGTFNGTTGLTRDTVQESSNANALITLSGTSNVFCTASAELISVSSSGRMLARAMRQAWD